MIVPPPAAPLPESKNLSESKQSDLGVRKTTVPVDNQLAGPPATPSPQAESRAESKPGSSDKPQTNLATERAASVKSLGQAIVDFHRGPLVLALIVDALVVCVVFGVLSFAALKLGNYLWYPAALVAVFVWTWVHGQTDYFWVFALGMCTAFAEIISKFRDEPLESVRTGFAILYHIFNGVIAILALYVLEIVAGSPTTESDHLKNVLVAGLGAMLIMRSKLFNIKVGGQDISFGPEQIVKIFLSYMEEEIDRIRAAERLDLINRYVDMLQLERSRELANHIVAMTGSRQLHTDEQRARFENKLDQICGVDGPEDPRDKCCAICFEVLNTMGEDFALQLFRYAPPTIRSVAPATEGPSQLKRIVVAATPFMTLPPEDVQYLMTYGAGMSGVRFRYRLKWSEEQYRKMPARKRCELPKYRVVFNKPDDKGTGRANLVADEGAKVEGVLYTLSKEQVRFLDEQLPGCMRRTERVKTEDGKFLDAEVYFASHTKESLAPNADAVNDMINGAQEHKLSPDYIEKLREFAAKSVTPDLSEANPES